MIEKVNPNHPDKVADRIAGALVDLAYGQSENPKVAVEVLIGHGECNIIAESSVNFGYEDVYEIVQRIAGDVAVRLSVVPQDCYLSKNQAEGIRCGDNGIFKGVPLSEECLRLSSIARNIYDKYKTDGKYILDGDELIICQSNATTEGLKNEYPNAVINPLGYWTGGTSVDTGATNRKLGSDMGDAVTGGGLHGKDLSKADVSVNIFAHLLAQMTGKEVRLKCAIGDSEICGIKYDKIVAIARDYVNTLGGFEKLAEWGLF